MIEVGKVFMCWNAEDQFGIWPFMKWILISYSCALILCISDSNFSAISLSDDKKITQALISFTFLLENV